MKRTAHTIAQKYGWVAMENLKLKNMTKSAKGTVEDPGRNVKQKSGLNRSLARVAPYGMRMAILWALFKAGGRLILADPKYTSQTRPRCGYTSSTNRPAQAHFGCQLCGCTENADVAGALNVLKKSRTGSVRPSSELGNKSAAGTVLFFASRREYEESRVFILGRMSNFRGRGCPEWPVGALSQMELPSAITSRRRC